MPSQDTDYESIEIPENEDPKDYHYTTRRAEILQAVKNRGNPYSFNRRQLADRYGVHPSQITRDFQRLSTYISEHIGDDAKVTARTAMEQAVKAEQEKGNYSKAFYIALNWAQFLQSIGEMERAKLEADITHREAETATDDYAIIDADGEEVATEHGELPSGDVE